MEIKDLDADVRAAKNEYFRKWRAANKEKVREYNRKYWEKYAQKQQIRKAAEKESQEGNK